MMNSKKLMETAWVPALLDPRTVIRVDGHGFPFRFTPPPDWDTRRQTIGEHLIYYVLRGGCRASLDGRRRELKAADLCWVCPGTEFRFFAGGKSTLLRFRLSVVQKGRLLRLPWNFRIFPEAGAAAECCRELVEEISFGRFDRHRIAAAAALFSLKAFGGGRDRSRRPGLSAEVRRRISQRLLDEPGVRLSGRDLARTAGLSPDYFSRQFKKTYGVAPREWLLKQRLKQAAGLLAETDESILNVAGRLGYPDVYLFSRQFSAEFGQSPRAWRKLQARR